MFELSCLCECVCVVCEQWREGETKRAAAKKFLKPIPKSNPKQSVASYKEGNINTYTNINAREYEMELYVMVVSNSKMMLEQKIS